MGFISTHKMSIPTGIIGGSEIQVRCPTIGQRQTVTQTPKPFGWAHPVTCQPGNTSSGSAAFGIPTMATPHSITSLTSPLRGYRWRPTGRRITSSIFGTRKSVGTAQPMTSKINWRSSCLTRTTPTPPHLTQTQRLTSTQMIGLATTKNVCLLWFPPFF